MEHNQKSQHIGLITTISSLAGSLSAAVICSPLDVIKTRFQIQVCFRDFFFFVPDIVRRKQIQIGTSNEHDEHTEKIQFAATRAVGDL